MPLKSAASSRVMRGRLGEENIETHSRARAEDQATPRQAEGGEAPSVAATGWRDTSARPLATPAFRPSTRILRSRAGLAAAKRQGRTGGRPPKLTEDDLEAARALLANPDIGVAHIADRPGASPATLYRYIPAARTANAPDG